MNLQGPFLSKNFIGAISDFEQARVVMLGMPFDGTCTNRPGTRFAPERIRLESAGIEVYSPTFDKNLEDTLFFDAGDLELPFGSAQKALEIIRKNVEQIYSAGKKLLGVGGEHLVTLASVQAAAKYFDNLAILHFDAHTDLREEFLGEKLTHSGVIRQVADIVGFENILQIGIRSGEKPEFELMKKHNTLIFKPAELERLRGKSIFLTIDLDVLDPGVMSAVGTPEAGGMTYSELLGWLVALKNYNIIGADIVELLPDLDITKKSTACACTLIREVLMLL
ncbi:putative agmatinase [Candidatus Gastranaerophilus sp. (ex Termes propinquus)]|nr:putative agmatinase [Candidatus Gastranaerophilus sp. (ex Termes propinquus)]